jgi:hypothetical protein
MEKIWNRFILKKSNNKLPLHKNFLGSVEKHKKWFFDAVKEIEEEEKKVKI